MTVNTDLASLATVAPGGLQIGDYAPVIRPGQTPSLFQAPQRDIWYPAIVTSSTTPLQIWSITLPGSLGVGQARGTVWAQNIATGDAIGWDVAAMVKYAGLGGNAAWVGTGAPGIPDPFVADSSMTACGLIWSLSGLALVLNAVGLSSAVNWTTMIRFG